MPRWPLAAPDPHLHNCRANLSSCFNRNVQGIFWLVWLGSHTIPESVTVARGAGHVNWSGLGSGVNKLQTWAKSSPTWAHQVMLIHLDCLLFSCCASSYDRDRRSCKAKNMFHLACIYNIYVSYRCTVL